MAKLCIFVVLAIITSQAMCMSFRRIRQATFNKGSSTIPPMSVEECLRTCPVTTEFNPVCGTDNVTYSNPGRLYCAKACGRNTSLFRASTCPPSTVAPAAAN